METQAEPRKERRAYRRMMRAFDRIRPMQAYVEGRLHDRLQDMNLGVYAIYGVMRGETEPSAFLALTETTTRDGITQERYLVETHNPNDVLRYFDMDMED